MYVEPDSLRFSGQWQGLLVSEALHGGDWLLTCSLRLDDEVQFAWVRYRRAASRIDIGARLSAAAALGRPV